MASSTRFCRNMSNLVVTTRYYKKNKEKQRKKVVLFLIDKVIHMKEKFLKSSMNFITKNETIDEETKEKIAFGLEGLYLSVTKLIIINLLAFLLGIWLEFVIFLALFNFLRFFGFGAHANNSKTCLITSSLLLVGTPYLFLKLSLPTYLIYTLCTTSIIIFILYAPADTEKRPLTNKKKRKIRKFMTVIVACIFTIIIVILKNHTIKMLLLSSLIVESIMVLPITYKILKIPYRNYLKV